MERAWERISERRRIGVIVNPVSGRCDFGAVVRAVRRELAEQGVAVKVDQTRGTGHATELARELVGRCDALLVIGGDGTIREVANGLASTDLPMAVVGTGTENLFARAIGLPREPRFIASILRSAGVLRWDIGRLNGRAFLAVAGIGFDAECVRRMAALRRGHITHADYLLPVWRTFWEHQFPHLRIVADGRRVFDDRGLAIVGGLPRYALGLGITPSARPDDGVLDLCAFRCPSRTRLLLHAWRTLCNKHIKSRDVVSGQFRRIEITSDRSVPVEADGDLAGFLPGVIHVEPGALAVLDPRSVGTVPESVHLARMANADGRRTADCRTADCRTAD
jgi:diacylglycerol kinase (ATP)